MHRIVMEMGDKYHIFTLMAIAIMVSACGEKDLRSIVEKNDVKALEKRLDEGLDPNTRMKIEDNDIALLALAAISGQDDMVMLLIKNGAKIDVLDKFGRSPLDFASYRHWTRIMSLLLDAGANPNIQDNTGVSPLQSALYLNDYMASVKLLINHGAKVDLENNEGQTPLGFAREQKMYNAVAFMEKHADN